MSSPSGSRAATRRPAHTRTAAALVVATLAGFAPLARGVVPACADQTDINTRCETWSQHVRGADVSDPGRENVTGIVATGNGQRLYAVTTTTPGSGSTHQTLTALVAGTGQPLWTAQPPASAGATTATAFALSRDESHVVVAGSAGNRAFVAGYAAASGRVLWTALLGDAADANVPVDVVASPRSDRVLVAVRRAGGGREDGYVVAVDVRSGRTLWRRQTAGKPVALAIDPAGDRVYVAGALKRPDGAASEFATYALDVANGRLRWERATRHGMTNKPVDIAVTGRGDQVVVLGEASATQPPEVVFYTASLAASDGRLRWSAVESGDAHTSGVPTRVVTSGDRVYVTGGTGRAVAGSPDTTPVAPQQFTTAAYDARTGQRAWRTSYAPPGGYAGYANAIAVDATGSMLYVAGTVAPSAADVAAPADLAVVAYRSDGTQAWLGRWDVREPDSAARVVPVAVAVPRLGGRMFVAASYEPFTVPAPPSVPLPPGLGREAPDPCEPTSGDTLKARTCDVPASSAFVVAYGT